MKERFEQCAFLDIIGKSPPKRKEEIMEMICRPFCKEVCPVKLPILEFTGDGVVPYIEKGDEIDPPIVNWSAIDKYIDKITHLGRS